MDQTMEGKVAVVTGASRGIGKAIAVKLASKGATVVINYNGSRERAEEVKNEVESAGGKAVIIQCNVADFDACKEFIERVIKEQGRIDILVNNAGITKDGLLMKMSEEDFDKVLDTNLKGTFHTIRAALRQMIRQRSGRIINMASVVGVSGNAGQANYAASKAGVIGLTKTAAREVASRGITVNAVAPGFIETEMMDQMTDAELDRKLSSAAVYARVSPEHKIRIVEAWQRRGQIVAMKGDGVNDAPALKKADIGVAMGMMGAEVSKDAASMILTDDNFATMIKAVANGRNVYRNIRNAIQFLLSGNMAGIFCVLYASVLALPMPFAPVHLLFINLLTDSLPAIAIGMEPADRDLLNQPPRDPKEGILSFPFAGKILFQGFLIGAATMWAWEMGYSQGGEAIASTMAFSTLTLARLFHGFNCRGRKSLLSLGIGSNLWCVMALFVGVVLMCAVLFVPKLQDVFAAGDLTGSQLLAVVLGALAPTAVIQIYKMMSAGTA